MDDEELLRRLGEIEGEAQWEDAKGKFAFGWNPLANDAQAMVLLKKHHVCIDRFDHSNEWLAMLIEPTSIHRGVDPSLNRAICLAIVAAKED